MTAFFVSGKSQSISPALLGRTYESFLPQTEEAAEFLKDPYAGSKRGAFLHAQMHRAWGRGWLPSLSRSTAECGWHHIPGEEARIDVVEGTDKVQFGGVARCHNANICPLCAPGRRADGQEKVNWSTEWLESEGYHAVFATFTISHNKKDALLDLRKKLFDAYSGFTGGRWWENFCSDMCLDFSIGSFEVTTDLYRTRGRITGWHPHLHVLFYVKEDKLDDFVERVDDLKNRWVKQCSNKNAVATFKDGLVVEVFSAGSTPGEYMYKAPSYSLSHELTDDTRSKKGKNGRITYFQLLELASDMLANDPNHRDTRYYWRLIDEYIQATKHVQFMRYSKGLLEHVHWADHEKQEEELEQRKKKVPLILLDNAARKVAYHRMCYEGTQFNLLTIARKGGKIAVLEALHKVYPQPELFGVNNELVQ